MAFTADIPQFPEFSAEDTRKVMRDNALDLLGCERLGVGLDTPMSEWPIGAVLDAIADAVPDRVMTICGTRSSTFAEVRGSNPPIGKLSGGQGFRCTCRTGDAQHWECGQDRVALIMHNDLYPDMVIACLKARVVPVNVNHHYTPREIAELLAYVRPVASSTTGLWAQSSPTCCACTAPTC